MSFKRSLFSVLEQIIQEVEVEVKMKRLGNHVVEEVKIHKSKIHLSDLFQKVGDGSVAIDVVKGKPHLVPEQSTVASTEWGLRFVTIERPIRIKCK